jgi:hypothetical protein
MRRAPRSQSRRMTMLPSFINSSGSPTTLPSLLLRTCHAPVSGTSWVVKVPGTTSTPASIMLLIGPAHTTMSCGCWSAFVTTLVSPPLTSGCSRVRATAAPISKSATFASQQTDLLVDVTVRHNFKGTGHNGQTQGQLHNSDNPDHVLESAAADKIRNYRDTCRRNRHVAFLPACMSTSGRIHGELLRLIFFLSNKQAEDYFAALGYQLHRQEFCHRRGVFFQRNRGTIGMACAQAVALRGAPTTARRHVAAPRRPPPLHMAYDDHDRNVSHIHGFA